jgi:hypothetical protein
MPTRDQYIAAFEQTGGNVVKSAEALGVTPPTIYNALKADPSLQVALEQTRPPMPDEPIKELRIWVGETTFADIDAIAEEVGISRSALGRRIFADFVREYRGKQ